MFSICYREVVQSLRLGLEVPPESFESVTIYFSYINGFADFVASSVPLAVVNFLDMIYSRFDESLVDFQVSKIEATGDNYMVR